MEKQKSGRKGSASVGVFCVIIGGILLYSQVDFWGWFFLVIGSYGLTIGVLEGRIGHEKASNVSMFPSLGTAILGLYFGVIQKSNTTWVLALSWLFLLLLGTLMLQGLFSFAKSGRIRFALKSFSIIVLAVALSVVYSIYAYQNTLLGAGILFFAVVYLRQGLGGIIVQSSNSNDKMVFFIPDFIVLTLLLFGFRHYQSLLFVHLSVITLVLSLFDFSTEYFIREIKRHEQQKIDKVESQPNLQFTFFRSLTGFHSGINLLLFPIFLGYLGLSLDQYVVQMDIQSDVFQVSISLLGLVVGFSTLILGEKFRKNDQGWERQTYLLRGLGGLTFLFFSIAVVSFIGISLKSAQQGVSLPSAAVILKEIHFNNDIQLQLFSTLTNEFVLFAIPAALLYFLALSQDFIERFRDMTDNSTNHD